ncbi:hypothetical protein Bca101_052313 [Brassica carinata]
MVEERERRKLQMIKAKANLSHFVAVPMSILQPVYSVVTSRSSRLKIHTNLHLRQLTSPVLPPPDPPDPPDPPNLPSSLSGSPRRSLTSISNPPSPNFPQFQAFLEAPPSSQSRQVLVVPFIVAAPASALFLH